VLDRGFYSENNINYLMKNHFNFIISLPSCRKWIEKLIDKFFDMIKLPKNHYHIGDGETIFAITHIASKHIARWTKPKKCIYLHIIYQHDKVNTDYKTFLDNINKLKEQIEQGWKQDKFLKNNYSKYLKIIKII
jgi:transposase